MMNNMSDVTNSKVFAMFLPEPLLSSYGEVHSVCHFSLVSSQDFVARKKDDAFAWLYTSI